VYKDNTGEILADGIFEFLPAWGATDHPERHYAAYSNDVILLDDAQFLELVSPSERDPTFARLRALATHGSGQVIDCGRIVTSGKSSELTDCAIKAFAARKPFYVRYYVAGIDSFGIHALAGDAEGNVTEVDYDSMGWFSRGLPKRI